MKDFDEFSEIVLEDYFDEPFRSISVEMERIGTRRRIPKELTIQVDGRIVSQLKSEIPEDESWEYLFFLLSETRKWEIRDFHYND